MHTWTLFSGIHTHTCTHFSRIHTHLNTLGRDTHIHTRLSWLHTHASAGYTHTPEHDCAGYTHLLIGYKYLYTEYTFDPIHFSTGIRLNRTLFLIHTPTHTQHTHTHTHTHTRKAQHTCVAEVLIQQSGIVLPSVRQPMKEFSIFAANGSTQ